MTWPAKNIVAKFLIETEDVMLKPSDQKPRPKPLSLYPLTPKQALRAALTGGKPKSEKTQKK